MNFSWFIDLGHLAQTQNFSRAAALSNISQPAFSRRIQAIEDWVGAALVDRSRHPVTLTSAGEQMLEAGQQALARLEAERRQIREVQALPHQYMVTFGAQHSIGWRFYPAWLQAFERIFGPVMSRLRADDLPSCIHDLGEGKVDFVIAYSSAFAKGVEDRPGLESLVIGTDVLTPVCRPMSDGRPLFDLESGSIEIPFLRFGDTAPISWHLTQMLTQGALSRRLRTAYENSMSGALRIRAREGAGVAWLPKSLVSPDLDTGALVLIGNERWDVPLEIRLYRLREHSNKFTRSIWTYLSVRDPVALMPDA